MRPLDSDGFSGAASLCFERLFGLGEMPRYDLRTRDDGVLLTEDGVAIPSPSNCANDLMIVVSACHAVLARAFLRREFARTASMQRCGMDCLFTTGMIVSMLEPRLASAWLGSVHEDRRSNLQVVGFRGIQWHDYANTGKLLILSLCRSSELSELQRVLSKPFTNYRYTRRVQLSKPLLEEVESLSKMVERWVLDVLGVDDENYRSFGHGRQ